MSAVTHVRRTARAATGAVSSSWRTALLGVFVVVLGATLLSGPVQRYRDTQARVDWLRQQLATVDDWQADADERLEHATSQAGRERAIREQLGWVRPGETVLLRDRDVELTIPRRPPDPAGGR